MKKLIIIGVLLLLTIGVATAADIDKMKMPEDFESTGGGQYRQVNHWDNGGTGFNVVIVECTDSNLQEWTTNNSDFEYSVTKTMDIYWYTDMDIQGVFEIVEIDGEKYIVDFSASSKADGGVDQAYKYMMEFNDLNNLKPISV